MLSIMLDRTSSNAGPMPKEIASFWAAIKEEMDLTIEWKQLFEILDMMNTFG
jgi:hypothetical protein